MVQSYFGGNGTPGITPPGSGLYNLPGWYVSALLMLWLLENACFCAAAALARRGRFMGPAIGLAACFIWPFIWPFAGVPYAPCDWFDYRTRAAGFDLSSWRNVPAFRYVECYVSGVFLAFLLSARADVGHTTRWAASAASGLLLLVFCLDTSWWGDFNVRTWAARHLIYSPALMPLHWLLIVGLAEGADPLSRLFSAWRFPDVCARLSFGIYILQTPVHQLLCLSGAMGEQARLDWQIALPTFDRLDWRRVLILFAMLLPAAWLAHELIRVPLQQAADRRLRKREDAALTKQVLADSECGVSS